MPHYNSLKTFALFSLVQSTYSIEPYYFLKIFRMLHDNLQYTIFHQDNLQLLLNYIESMARVKSWCPAGDHQKVWKGQEARHTTRL